MTIISVEMLVKFSNLRICLEIWNYACSPSKLWYNTECILGTVLIWVRIAVLFVSIWSLGCAVTRNVRTCHMSLLDKREFSEFQWFCDILAHSCLVFCFARVYTCVLYHNAVYSKRVPFCNELVTWSNRFISFEPRNDRDRQSSHFTIQNDIIKLL